ncbi:hypothetical protein NH342_20480, partial [Klenkia sp. PcliD-1-E]|nr:hypothetical protein [Klenkia sp. PcliD-1-E]
MSDRTQGSVRTDDAGADADPETAAIPTEKPGSGSGAPDVPPPAADAARPAGSSSSGSSSGSGSSGQGSKGSGAAKPAVAPGWGGAAPSGSAQASRPAGQAPSGPTQPAASST